MLQTLLDYFEVNQKKIIGGINMNILLARESYFKIFNEKLMVFIIFKGFWIPLLTFHKNGDIIKFFCCVFFSYYKDAYVAYVLTHVTAWVDMCVHACAITCLEGSTGDQ